MTATRLTALKSCLQSVLKLSACQVLLLLCKKVLSCTSLPGESRSGDVLGDVAAKTDMSFLSSRKQAAGVLTCLDRAGWKKS